MAPALNTTPGGQCTLAGAEIEGVGFKVPSSEILK